MEQMPYRDAIDPVDEVIAPVMNTPPAAAVVSSDWQDRLPVLAAGRVVLRELRASDAASLFAMLTTAEVARFISPPPNTVDGFERFIAWTHRQRSAGTYVCFAVTVKGFDTAVGIFQVRNLTPGFASAEWGFALGSAFWGTGLFEQGAALALEFAFDTLGVQRLEARAAIRNGRGNRALQKMGAVQEALLRKSFCRNGEYHDQALYTILERDWRASRGVVRPTSHPRGH
jgi:ribosomal-protein-alanine N-acetyltransferase